MKAKYKILIFLIFTLFILPLIFATTLRNTTITSTGLSSSISISTFEITFDKLEVSDNAITFYNLTYTNPSSCNSRQSSYSIYNYTTLNAVTTFPYIVCLEEEEEEETSGGTPTYAPTQEQPQQGYTKTLRKGWKVQVKVNNQKHVLKLDEIINKTTAVITVSSEPVTFNLTINQTKKLDLDNNDYYDLEVFLKDIKANEADLVMKSINETVFVEDGGDEENEVEKTKWWWGVLSLAIVIVGAILIGKYNRKERKGR